MLAVLPVVDSVFARFAPAAFKIEFTAGQEWFNHNVWSSLHHSGNAIDIRTKTLPDHGIGSTSRHIAEQLQRELDSRFGRRRYTVLWNDSGPTKPHIHVQFNSGLRMSEPGDFIPGQASALG